MKKTCCTVATSASPVGFVGLGNMGASMAKNLLKNSYEVIVCDVNKAAVSDLESAGARSASTPAQIASQASTIVTMLPSSPQVLQVYTNKDGIFRQAQGAHEPQRVMWSCIMRV